METQRGPESTRLADLGWDEAFARSFEAWRDDPNVRPGRVAIEFNYIYRLYVEDGELDAVRSGRLKHRAASRGELPAVGDWVALRRRPGHALGAIVAVLPRRSRFSRRMAGQITGEQVVAANVGVLFVVMALDADFSVRRLERYLLLARESGASPVVLLTKPDLTGDPTGRRAEVQTVAGNAPVHVVSPLHGEGIATVSGYLPRGHTGALVGSSGVGKTTIINRLIGTDARRTREVRERDSKGRHTTTHRELIALPGGGLLIDTPGMRELQLWDAADAVRGTFEDIDGLAGACRFTDCRHRGEPRCAVRAAVDDGRLDAGRLEGYLKLQEELVALEEQQEARAQIEERRRSKTGRRARRVI
jgi:ribosome biogenesis GTPase / thiamine phosphate phosphatase